MRPVKFCQFLTKVQVIMRSALLSWMIFAYWLNIFETLVIISSPICLNFNSRPLNLRTILTLYPDSKNCCACFNLISKSPTSIFGRKRTSLICVCLR